MQTCRAVSSQVQHVLALILLSWKAIFRAGRLDIPFFEYLQKSFFFPQFIHLSHRVSLSFDMNYAKYRMLLNSVSNAHTVNFTARLTF